MNFEFINRSTALLPIDRLKAMSQVTLPGGTKISLLEHGAPSFNTDDYSLEAALVVKGLARLSKEEFVFGKKSKIRSLGSDLENIESNVAFPKKMFL